MSKHEQRDMTVEEQAIIRDLYEAKAGHGHKTAYCTVAKPITLSKWNGVHPVDKNTTDVVVQPGTTLKIVMVSRFGDCGLTDDLDADHGYHVRVNPDDKEICDVRWGREPTWPDPVDREQEALDALLDNGD